MLLELLEIDYLNPVTSVYEVLVTVPEAQPVFFIYFINDFPSIVWLEWECLLLIAQYQTTLANLQQLRKFMPASSMILTAFEGELICGE